MLYTQLNTENRTGQDDLAQRRIQRKTEQMQGVKLLLAIILFIGAIMETPMPQPETAKLSLDCPLVQKIQTEPGGSYSLGSQSCSWKVL